MNFQLGLVTVALVVAWSSACAVEDDDDPQQDEGGTTDGMSAAEECEAAVEALDEISCAPGLSFYYSLGDDVGDLIVISLEEARIELPHGYLYESGGQNVLIGETFAHNEQCFVGCLVSLSPGQDYCVGVDAEGNDVCGFIGATDVESCETFTEACAGG